MSKDNVKTLLLLAISGLSLMGRSEEALQIKKGKGHRYELTEFVRVQGDEPHLEKHHIDPVFFTPALESQSLQQLPSPGRIDEDEILVGTGLLPAIIEDVWNNDPIQSNELSSTDSIRGSWRLRKRTNRGANGEVWRGTRVSDNNEDETGGRQVYVLKRMLLEKGDKIKLAAAREQFFGELMWDSKFSGHVAQYVESFTNTGGGGDATELWLVFVDEGISLHEWLYTPVDFVGGTLLMPSEAWQRMRTSKHGRAQIQELLRQVFLSALALHTSNITHRDIKTSNVVWRLREDEAPSSSSSLLVVLIDFSSAYSQDALDHGLFGKEGPCEEEETRGAIPPERFFATAPLTPTASFDSWDIGVLMLELLLGSQSVFTVDQRTRALLAWKLRDEPPEELEQALFRSALGDFCILEPRPVISSQKGSNLAQTADVLSKEGEASCPREEKVRCGLVEFADALQRRDPLEIGYLNTLGVDGLDFLSKLLRWDPVERLSAQEALDHPFLQLSAEAEESQEPSFSLVFSDHPNLVEPEELVANIPLSLSAPSPPNQPVVSDKFNVGPYRCPKCGRQFHSYDSCLRHALARRHSLWCDPAPPLELDGVTPFELSKEPLSSNRLPICLSSHSLLPEDKLSGWCDVQGRRVYLEDHCGVVYASDYIIWSVFDGHVKASAAQFAAHYLPAALARHLSLDKPTAQQVRKAFLETDAALLSDQASQLNHVMVPLRVPFHDEVQQTGSLLGRVSDWFRRYWWSPSKVDPQSSSPPFSLGNQRTPGTTATTAMITKTGYLVVANVGDSRAVMCCQEGGRALNLTRDHTAEDREEAARVEQLGAKIIWGNDEGGGKKGLARVNGEVAVTRSFGDASLKQYLTAEPHVVVLNIAAQPVRSEVAMNIHSLVSPDFLVVATDGLWDVMTSQEVVDYVQARRAPKPVTDKTAACSQEEELSWQRVAMALTHEALLRGSLDNVGVCVIDIKNRIPWFYHASH